MSLFNRPAWATSKPAEEDSESTNLFRHSSRSYGEIVAEQERRRREKKRKEGEKPEGKKDKGKARVVDEQRSPVKGGIKAEGSRVVPVLESASKRRRISEEDAKALLSSVGFSKPVVVLDDDEEDYDSGVHNHAGPSTRQSPRKTRGKTSRLERSESGNSLNGSGRHDDNNDDDDDIEITGIAPVPGLEPVDEESDDEFAELTRKARQQRQQKEADARSLRPPDGQNTSTSHSARLKTDDLPDPVIQLFISSPIPNTNPLIVQRKLSQRTQEIREVWCSKQGFTKEFTQDVFFIHRMHRVYDFTTCRSLGLEVDVFGNITMKGAEGREGVDKVHLEAVTDEIYKQMREDREREAQRRTGQLAAGGTNGDAALGDDHVEGETPRDETLIRLTLKARDKDDFKLKVKPTTRIAKIMAAYSKKFAPDKTVSLEFDGERLNPEDEVQDTEISDLDCVDVYLL